MEPKLYFSREEFADRIARTRAEMAARGLDLLIVSDPSNMNMNWLTGYDGWSFYVHQCVVLGLQDGPIWFGRGQDANGALRTCHMPVSDIIGYPDHYVQSTERHPMDYLSAQLADRGLSQGHHRRRDGQLLVLRRRLCLAAGAFGRCKVRGCHRAGELAAGG